MAAGLKFQLDFFATGIARSVGDIQALRKAAEEAASAHEKASQVAQAAHAKATIAAVQAANAQANAAREAAKGQTQAAAEAVKAAEYAERRASRYAQAAAQAEQNKAVAGANQTLADVRLTQAGDQKAAAEGNSSFFESLGQIAFRFNNIVTAVRTLAATAVPVYEALIASNERLNAQMLSSQTNLASSSRIFSAGTEVTDPTEKIRATQGAIRAALRQIEEDTLSLVGVTSSQVNELFQITLSNASRLNQQSKQFPEAIGAATSLTKGWAASLQVMGVPLFQARQEINSILKAQIDQNSIVAKNLNITNDQVRKWQSQGILVDELNKRLEVFVAGNAIAARSIAGISSNLTDYYERISRQAGEPLLKPLIDLLAKMERYVKANEETITGFIKRLAEGGAFAVESLEHLAPLFEGLAKVAKEAEPLVLGLFQIISQGAIITTVKVVQELSPILDAIALVLKGYAEIANAIQFRQIADANDALEAYQAQTRANADAVYELLGRFHEYNKIREAGGQLTAEQIEQEKLAKAASVNTIATIDAEIKSLKELKTLRPEITAARENEIKILEGLRVKLEKGAGGIRTEARLLEELGTRSEQFVKKFANAKRLLEEEGQGDPTIFAQAAKDLIDLAEKGVEAKDITVETARQEIEAIRENKKQEFAIQTAANEAITKLYNGRIAKIHELIKAGALESQKGLEELERIRRDETLKIEVRRKAAEQILAIKKEEIAAETEAINTQKIRAQLAQAERFASEVETEKRLTDIKLAEIEQRKKINAAALEASPDGTAERAKLLQESIQLELEKSKTIAEQQKKDRENGIKFFDEIRNLVQAQNTIGLTDKATYNAQVLANDLQQNELQLAQQEEALAMLAESDTRGRSALEAQIAQSLAKRLEIQRNYDKQEIERANTRYAQELKILETGYDNQVVSEAAYLAIRASLKAQKVQEEIGLQRVALGRLGAMDVEGRKAIEARLAELNKERLQALDELYQGQVDRARRAQERATAAVADAEVQRTIAIAEAQRSRTATVEAGELGRLLSAKATAEQQLAVARELEADLVALAGQTRSATQEREYQKSVLSARKATADATLKLLEQQIRLEDESYRLRLGTIDRYQRQSTELNALAEVRRQLAIAQLQAAGFTREEALEADRLNLAIESAREKVRIAEEAEAEIAKLADLPRSSAAQREYEQQVRSSAKATSDARLALASQSQNAIEYNRRQEIVAIEQVAATSDRATKEGLAAITAMTAARANALKEVESATNGTLAALNREAASVDRTTSLYQARATLVRAMRDAETTQDTIEVTRVKRAEELVAQLRSGTLAYEQQSIVRRQLAQLGVSESTTLLGLRLQTLEAEDRIARRKREELDIEQTQARQALLLEKQKEEISLRRQTIEASIAKIKADIALIDARAAASSQALSGQQAVVAATAELDKAKALAPGERRDVAVAEATSRLAIVRQEAESANDAAATNVLLARDAVKLSELQVAEVAREADKLAEIFTLRERTLSVVQQAARENANAAEATRQQALELERANVAAQSIAQWQNSVRNPTAYTGDATPNLLALPANAADLNNPVLNRPSDRGNGDVVRAVDRLTGVVEGRTPTVNSTVNLQGADDRRRYEEYMQQQRSLLRGSI